jgi:hypothetical protein
MRLRQQRQQLPYTLLLQGLLSKQQQELLLELLQLMAAQLV